MLSTLRWPRPITGLTAALAAAMTPLVWTPAGQAEQAAAPAITAALDQVADGAEVVVVVPSLSGLSEGIAEFSTATGLDRFGPEMDDVLGAFKQQMGWREGVDDDGAAIAVVSGIAQALHAQVNGGAAREPQTTLLVPVSDYPAFVGQLGGQPSAAVTPITMPDGTSGYAKQLNGYAALSSDQAPLTLYLAGDKGVALTQDLGPMVTDYLNGGDSLVYVDVAALAEPLNLAIDQGRDEIAAELAGPNAGIPDALKGTVMGMLKLYEDSARSAIDGTDKLVLALDFGDQGVGLTIASQLVEGSELANFFTPPANADGTGAASTSGTLLATLPDQPFIYAGAIDADRFGLEAVFKKIKSALGGDNAGFLATHLESLDALEGVNGVASVFYTPDPAAMLAGGFYTTLTVYDTDNAEAYLAQHKSAIEKLNDLKVPLPATQPGRPAGQISFNAAYTEKALVVDGIDVHRFQITTVLPQEMMQQFGPVAALMGNSGSSGYLAVKDGKVLVTTVPDTQLITRGLKAVGQNDGVGSAGTIATLRENDLPANSSLELYVSVAGIANTANPFLVLLPNFGPLDPPADLSPLAMGGASDGESVALRMFVPHDLVKFAAQTYEQFAPAAQARGGRGASRPPRAF